MLSPKELKYLQDQDFLLSKVKITDFIFQQLSEVKGELRTFIEQTHFPFPEKTDLKNGKISKGEKYQNLPYLILDFPKRIDRESVFALRTMLWWGKEWSCTLHLQGKAWEDLKATFQENYQKLFNQEVFICIKEHPWEYHFGADNYQKIEGANLETILSKEFLKISRKLEIQAYSELKAFVLESFELYLGVLK